MFVVSLLQLVCSFVLLLDTMLYNRSMYEEFEVNNIYRIFLCSLCLFVMNCFTDDPVNAGLKPGPKDSENLLHNMETSTDGKIPAEPKVSPRVYSSFLSHITFYWYSEFFKITKTKPVEFDDIWQLEDDMKIDLVSKRFNSEYDKELENIEKFNQNSSKKIQYNSWSTMKVGYRTYRNRILFCSLLRFLNDVIAFVKPVLLG